jgi:predicted esterase
MRNLSSSLGAVPYGAEEPSAALAAILLHGRWESPAHMTEIAGRIAAPDVAYFALPAPGATWYPESFLAPEEVNREKLEDSLGLVDALVRSLEARGWSRERIVLIGYSQGACLACEYVYRNPGPWAGLIAFTGGLVGPPGTTWATDDDLSGLPVLLSNGDADPWVPWERVQETAAVFRAEKAEVEVRLYPGREHLVSDDECVAARAILARAAAQAGVAGAEGAPA